MKNTTERDYYTALALAQLRQAQRTRQNRDDMLQAAIAEHGDVDGTPTSGIYNPAFPEFIKNELRTLAHNIGCQVETAFAFWRKAGRRTHTLRRQTQAFRKLRDGRISYY